MYKLIFYFCRYGRFNTVKQLLDSEKGSFIINETDGEGLTPLHIASQQGKYTHDYKVKPICNLLILSFNIKGILFKTYFQRNLKTKKNCLVKLVYNLI